MLHLRVLRAGPQSGQVRAGGERGVGNMNVKQIVGCTHALSDNRVRKEECRLKKLE
jgi:hypothetical protein